MFISITRRTFNSLPFNSFTKRFYSNNLFTELKERKLVASCSNEKGLVSLLNDKKVTVYCGVDPTGDSLHLGHLFSFLTLLRFHQFGHKVIALIGGATGSIGDPSGRSTERQALSSTILEKNQSSLHNQLNEFFKIVKPRIPIIESTMDIKIKNNLEWFGNMSLIEFINTTGRIARISNMLNKESVKSRLDSKQGLSFTEFSYQLLQAHDFNHLYQNEGCQLQIGGNDQWGNILSGIDLISKQQTNTEVYGLTTPLLTTSNGMKIGKSLNNATIWLNKEKTGCYLFYQYFMKLRDDEILDFLLRFTFLPINECHDIYNQHMLNPDKLEGQRQLAQNVTRLVHGESGLEEAELVTKVLFQPTPNLLSTLTKLQLSTVFNTHKDVVTVLNQNEPLIGQNLVDLCVKSGLTKSKGETNRLIQANGLYLNQIRVLDQKYQIQSKDLLGKDWGIMLRAGKTKFKAICLPNELKRN